MKYTSWLVPRAGKTAASLFPAGYICGGGQRNDITV